MYRRHCRRHRLGLVANQHRRYALADNLRPDGDIVASSRWRLDGERLK
jgi:hypothetical protein